jgi:polysaccharide pyruvyl transferase WcaK-like protein
VRILLDPGLHDLQNKGNIVMLQVAVSRLHRLWPTALIGVVTRGPNVLRYYCPEAYPVSLDDTANWSRNKHNGLQQFIPRPVWRILFESRELVRYQRYMARNSPREGNALPVKGRDQNREQNVGENREAENENAATNLEAVQGADLLVASGAGIMCDIAKVHALSVLDRLEAAIRNNIPTVMVGQQIGPIQDPALLTKAKAVLPAVDMIAIRERRIALPLLESLGVNVDRVIMTGDDAIEMVYKARSAKLGVGIGVSMRAQSYMEIEDSHLQIIRSVLHQAAAKFNAPLVSLPISYSFHEEDAQVIRQLLQGNNNVMAIGYTRFSDPLQIIKNTGWCRLVVTGVYHAAVFALAQGIPVVGLARSMTYKEKLLGLADEFGSGCQVIFLDQARLQEKLTATIETAWQAAEDLRPQLLEVTARQIELGHSAYRRMYQLVESKPRKA